MSIKRIRTAVRTLHLIEGVFIAVFTYSSLRTNETYLTVMQVITVPAIVLSGILLWQQPRILRLFRSVKDNVIMTNISQHTPDDDYNNFQYYPFNSVVGFVPDETQTEAALKALNEAGFVGDTVGILYGERGIEVLDRSGKGHGLFGRIARSLQEISAQEIALLRRSKAEMPNGSFLFRVRTNGDREVMQEVRTILKQFGGYFITFYHRPVRESLTNRTIDRRN